MYDQKNIPHSTLMDNWTMDMPSHKLMEMMNNEHAFLLADGNDQHDFSLAGGEDEHDLSLADRDDEP